MNEQQFTEDIRERLEVVLSHITATLEDSLDAQLYRIKSRVKTVTSMNRKLSLDRWQGKSWTDLPDYCGIAIVVHPLYKIQDVIKIITGISLWRRWSSFKRHLVWCTLKYNISHSYSFDINDAGPTHPSQFGYRAKHIDAVIAQNPVHNPCDPFKVEIQVRSVFQDIWDSVSHREYEVAREGSDPKKLPRSLHQLSAFLEIGETLADQIVLAQTSSESSRRPNSMEELKCFFTLHPARAEERKDWEFKELWQAIQENQIEDLAKKWEEFKALKIRATGSDILDFGAFLCQGGRVPTKSYYTLYPHYFVKLIQGLH